MLDRMSKWIAPFSAYDRARVEACHLLRELNRPSAGTTGQPERKR